VLSYVRTRCAVPPAEPVLAICFLISRRHRKSVLLFGRDGVYWCNPKDGPLPGPAAATYRELRDAPCVNHGDRIYMGNGRYLVPAFERIGADCDRLLTLLLDAIAVMAPPK